MKDRVFSAGSRVRVWAAQADDADAAAAGRSGDSDDRVVQIHTEIVAG